MEEAFEKQDNQAGWYVSQKPIEKYLKIEKSRDSIISKFVNLKPEKHLHRQKQIRQLQKIDL